MAEQRIVFFFFFSTLDGLLLLPCGKVQRCQKNAIQRVCVFADFGMAEFCRNLQDVICLRYQNGGKKRKLNFQKY